MLFTKEQIIEYLTSAKLNENYVCGDGKLCNMFVGWTTPSKVFGQKSMGPNMPARHWWIEYKIEENKFVLHCSYFDSNETPITREEFITLLKNKFTDEQIYNIPAVVYTPTAVIEWVSSGVGEWTARYSVVTRTSAYILTSTLNKILDKSILN